MALTGEFVAPIRMNKSTEADDVVATLRTLIHRRWSELVRRDFAQIEAPTPFLAISLVAPQPTLTRADSEGECGRWF